MTDELSILGWHFTKTTRLANGDGREIVAGETLCHEGDVVPCQSGLHFSERVLDALTYADGSLCWRVKGCGTTISHGNPIDKYACSERTALWVIDVEELLRRFARLCALRVLHLWDPPDIVVEYLITGEEEGTDAAGAAARDASWDSAGTRDATWDASRAASVAASRAAAVAASRARAAARDAAWDSAGAAAVAATRARAAAEATAGTRDAAQAAAWAATRARAAAVAATRARAAAVAAAWAAAGTRDAAQAAAGAAAGAASRDASRDADWAAAGDAQNSILTRWINQSHEGIVLANDIDESEWR